MIRLHQLPLARWRKMMREEPENWTFKAETFQKWQRRQVINNRIYGFISATVLALIGFLVMGGCR